MIQIDTKGKTINEYLENDKWYILYHHDKDSLVTNHDICKTILIFTPKKKSDLPPLTYSYYKEYAEEHPDQVCTVGKVNLFNMSYRERKNDSILFEEDDEEGYYVIIAHNHTIFFELTEDEILSQVVLDAI